MTPDRNTPFAPVLRFIPGDVPKWAEAAFDAFPDPLPCPVLVWYDPDGRYPNPRLRLCLTCEETVPGSFRVLMDEPGIYSVLDPPRGVRALCLGETMGSQAAFPWDDQLMMRSLDLSVVGISPSLQKTGEFIAQTLRTDLLNVAPEAMEKVNLGFCAMGHELGHIHLFGRLGQGFTRMEHELKADLHSEEGCLRVGDNKTGHVFQSLRTVSTFAGPVNYTGFPYWFDRSGSQPQVGVQAGAGLLELKLRAASLWDDKFADQTPEDFVLSVMGPRDGPSGAAARLFDRSRSTSDLLRHLKLRTQGRDLAFATPERVDHILDAAQRLFTRRFLKDLSIAPPYRSFAPALS